jgi:hypothetical protein
LSLFARKRLSFCMAVAVVVVALGISGFGLSSVGRQLQQHGWIPKQYPGTSDIFVHNVPLGFEDCPT